MKRWAELAWRWVLGGLRHSLKVRLATWLVITLVILYVAQGLVVGFMMRHVTEDYVARRLALDSEMLAAGVDFDGNGHMNFNNDRMPLVYRQPFSGHYYTLRYLGQQLSSRSLGGQGFRGDLAVGDSAMIKYLDGPLNQHLLAHVRDYDSNGRHVTVIVAQDLSHLKDEIFDLYGYYIFISIAALVTLIVVQTLIVTRGLRPLDNVRQQLRELEHGEREHLTEEVPAEITPLVREFNHLVDALALRLRRLRNATGNLAHALKTPLAVIGRGLQAPEVSSALRNELAPQVKIIDGLIERELTRARLASSASRKRLFSFEDEIPALVHSLQAVYREKKLIFDVQCAADGNYAVDREDMLELLGNLLDNASKWARARVRLRASAEGVLRVLVEDDGPGVDDALIDSLTKRGLRVDESTVGHGLGLAIVLDIVDNYHGHMHLGRSPRLGGFMATIELPLRRGKEGAVRPV